MPELFGAYFDPLLPAAWLKLLIDLLVKSTLVVAGFSVIALLLRKSTAALRCRIWETALVCLLVLPMIHFAVPSWSLPLLPDIAGIDVFSADAGNAAAATLRMEKNPPKVTLLDNGDLAMDDLSMSEGGLLDLWARRFVLLWSAGALVLAAGFALGRLGAWLLLKRARPVFAQEWQALFRRISSSMSVQKPVRLMKSQMIHIAMTTGVIRPAVIIPASSNSWDQERRQVVLAHELAHVRRKDALMEIVAKASLLIYWFSPLVWLAVRRLRTERERASDDMVINLGTRPSEYASQLMAVAAALSPFPRSLWQVFAITQGSGLKDRLLCILDPRVNRRKEQRFTLLLLTVLLPALILPVSAVGVWRQPPPPPAIEQPDLGLKNHQLPAPECSGFTAKEIQWIFKALESTDKVKRGDAKKKLLEMDRNCLEVLLEQAILSAKPEICEPVVLVFAKKDMYRVQALLKRAAVEGKTDKIQETAKKLMVLLKSKEGLQAQINASGYELLNKGKIDDAIKLFKMNVENFPESSNTYDSLAEAYMKKGERELAIKYYQKSLQLNPDNENAMKYLKELKSF